MEQDWRGWRRFLSYALIVLAPVFGLGAVLRSVVTTEADRSALNAGRVQAIAIGESAVVSQLEPRDLSRGLTSTERANLRRTSALLISEGTVMRFRIRDRAGAVLFDAADPSVTRVPFSGDDDEPLEAAEGKPHSSLTHMDSDAIDGSVKAGVEAIEHYLPIRSGDRIIGVFEVYVPYAPIRASRDGSLHHLYFTIGSGLLAVWLVLAAIIWSVTRRIHRQNARHQHQALHDPLTGLPNRILFADRLAHAMAAGRRGTADVSVAIVDLDNFKQVNDTLGHGRGDELLCEIGARLERVVRPGDTVARLGGDEFGIVLPHVAGDSTVEVLERVRLALAEDTRLAGVAISTESSIGWAAWPQHGDSAEELLRCADLALYAAKSVKPAVQGYDESLQNGDVGQLGIAAELRVAITSGELELWYQPKLDLSGSELSGFEALIRWRHPLRGLLAPADFIGVAESTGLIAPLTRWVIANAIAQLARWSAIGLAVPSVAVNVSARNLREPDLTDWIIGELRDAGVAPKKLTIEITETAITVDEQRAATHIDALRSAGVRVSLDDFGQGYTSLGQLARLNINELKIDRSFISAMQASAHDEAIVAAVIELGHRLGMTVVAEGIEDVETMEAVRSLGCDLAQGFHIARPLTAADIGAYVERFEAPSKREIFGAAVGH